MITHPPSPDGEGIAHRRSNIKGAVKKVPEKREDYVSKVET